MKTWKTSDYIEGSYLSFFITFFVIFCISTFIFNYTFNSSGHGWYQHKSVERCFVFPDGFVSAAPYWMGFVALLSALKYRVNYKLLSFFWRTPHPLTSVVCFRLCSVAWALQPLLENQQSGCLLDAVSVQEITGAVTFVALSSSCGAVFSLWSI